jgi:hypothetical protein
MPERLNRQGLGSSDGAGLSLDFQLCTLISKDDERINKCNLEKLEKYTGDE